MPLSMPVVPAVPALPPVSVVVPLSIPSVPPPGAMPPSMPPSMPAVPLVPAVPVVVVLLLPQPSAQARASSMKLMDVRIFVSFSYRDSLGNKRGSIAQLLPVASCLLVFQATSLRTAWHKHADLANGRAKDGTAFPGFNRTVGTWLLALRCSACKIPAPVALGIVRQRG
jgi:hypothetical protein